MTTEPRAVSIPMLKGGLGKSTVANALTDALARRGRETVLLDLDPEGHLSTGLGFPDRDGDGPDYRDVLFEGADPIELVSQTGFGFDLVPARNLEEVNRHLRREEVLRSDEQLRTHFVDPLLGETYDYVVMDLPGSRNKLTNNALVASRNVVLPVSPSAEAIHGVERTVAKLIGPLRQYMDVEILAVVPNGLRRRIDQDTVDRELLETINTSEAFAASLLAGRGADLEAGTLPDGESVSAVLDDHVPPFARITPEEWDRIDTGEREAPSVPIRHRSAFTRAYRERCPLSAYDPDCDQLEYFDELAAIVEAGGIEPTR